MPLNPSVKTSIPVKFGQIALYACLLPILWSCTSPPGRVAQDTSFPSILSNEQEIDRTLPKLDSILANVDQQTLLNTPELALDALKAAVQEQRWDIAQRIAQLIEPAAYTTDRLAEYTVAVLTLWVHDAQYTQADRWLNSATLQSRLPLMKVDDQITLSLARAEVLYGLGRYDASAKERVFIEDLLEEQDNIDANADALWKTLLKMPGPLLEQQHERAVNRSYKAWLELALIHHATEVDIANQAAQARAWRERWPNHNAARQIPSSIDVLQTLPGQRPQTIAVLVPLSGPLAAGGKAVQDGLTAAYFTALQQGWDLPTLTTYDTYAQPLDQLYQQAVQEGADFVIGPLEKDKVNELLTMPTSIPVITLNYVTNGMPPPRNVVQFGLAAEDEAMQLARNAKIAGYRNIIVLQSNADWARRASLTFRQQWTDSGGTVLENILLSNPDSYSAEISAALLLPTSETRHRRLESILGRQLEFTPRRRADIDLFIVFANSKQTKSIKPLLSYHYAGDIPIYSSSQVNDGSNRPQQNRDLNGIVFNEIPWVLKNNDIKKQVAERYKKNKQLGRLFAMGVDAFFIHPRISQLQRAPDSQISGFTGNLSLSNNRVVRELTMAKFSKGKAQTLNTSH